MCTCLNGRCIVSDSAFLPTMHISIGKRSCLSLTCLGLITEKLRLELFVVKKPQIDCSQDCLEPIIQPYFQCRSPRAFVQASGPIKA